MHLAFLTSMLPERQPTSGFAIANRSVVDGLRGIGMTVTSIGVRTETSGRNGEDDEVLATLELENARVGAAQKSRWITRAMTGGLPVAAAKLKAIAASTVRGAVADAEARHGPIAGFVVNSYQLAGAHPHLLERPYVYLSHNNEALTAANNARSASSVIERALYRRDARLLGRLEERLMEGARHVWCLSEEDRRSLGLAALDSDVLPLVLPDAPVLSNEDTKPFDAVMIGTWSWEANAAGLRWFLHDVLPQLPQDMRVAIAGSLPASIDVSDDRIIVMGRVDSADGFLAQGHVVPLVAQGGTGIQLKTIEAFQRGLATVATGSSVRGLDHLPSNCTVADDAPAFAAALVDAARRGRAGENLRLDGKAFAERQSAVLAERLRAGIDKLDRAA